MERAVQIARRNNYPFLQPKHLELLVEVNMTSRAKYGWSALQSAFTAPKFSATAGDARTEGKFATVLIIPSSWGSQLDSEITSTPCRITDHGEDEIWIYGLADSFTNCHCLPFSSHESKVLKHGHCRG
jgi:hypothetical protein